MLLLVRVLLPTSPQMGGGYPKDLHAASESFRQVVRSHQDVYVDAAERLSSMEIPEEDGELPGPAAVTSQ